MPMLEAGIPLTARALSCCEMVHNGCEQCSADASLDGLRKLLIEMSTDPAHPVRVKVVDLQTKAVAEAMKEQLLDSHEAKGREAVIRAARIPAADRVRDEPDDRAAVARRGADRQHGGRTG